MSCKGFFIAALLMAGACFTTLHAAVIVFRSGKTVEGDIVMQNAQVVVVRTAAGARFQYPTADILRITNDTPAENIDKAETMEKQPETTLSGPRHLPKTLLRVELAGGGAWEPMNAAGGNVAAHLMLGTRNLAGYPLFIGGSVGYSGLFLAQTLPEGELQKRTCSFLPIAVALRAPFTTRQHAPEAGLSVGYGIGVSKQLTGGLYAAIDMGYRYTVNERTALFCGLSTTFQQAHFKATETVENTTYTHNDNVHRNLVSLALKIAFSY